MKSFLRVFVLALAVMTMGASCGTNTQTTLATSGQALIQVGNSFNALGQTYMANCVGATAKASLAKFCADFKAFAPQFNQAYQPAVATWRAAVQANDVAKAQGAEATILGLGASLSTIAAQVVMGL